MFRLFGRHKCAVVVDLANYIQITIVKISQQLSTINSQMDQSDSLLDGLLFSIDDSFKYILIMFNLMTLVIVYIHKGRNKQPISHHVLLVTAHPDDEVMFFRPILTSITKDYFVHLLCLTGRQTAREEELQKSARNIGIHKVEICPVGLFKDQMGLEWPKQQIQAVVKQYCKSHTIEAIFTFDDYGVSGHQNHISISKALRQLEYQRKDLKFLNKGKHKMTPEEVEKANQISQDSMKIYHLTSVNIARKYSGCLEIIFAILKDFTWVNLNVFAAYRSMSIHKSQFCWYRRLWVLFSQYTYINAFQMTRVKIKKQLLTYLNKQQAQQAKQMVQNEEDQVKVKTK